jgi:hypothetical protein
MGHRTHAALPAAMFESTPANAGARLPFGAKDEAEFEPFLISSTTFGSSGYLPCWPTGTCFVGLEAGIEYGSVFTFGFGLLTATG